MKRHPSIQDRADRFVGGFATTDGEGAIQIGKAFVDLRAPIGGTEFIVLMDAVRCEVAREMRKVRRAALWSAATAIRRSVASRYKAATVAAHAGPLDHVQQITNRAADLVAARANGRRGKGAPKK